MIVEYDLFEECYYVYCEKHNDEHVIINSKGAPVYRGIKSLLRHVVKYHRQRNGLKGYRNV